MKTKVVPASEPDPKKGLRVSDYVDHENPKVKIKLRVLYQGDQFVGLLVPIGAEFGNNLVDMGSKNAIVTCMVLDGDEHMYPMGLRVDRFHKCPTAELEITGMLEVKAEAHKYDVAMLRALMRDGKITKDDLRAALEEA